MFILKLGGSILTNKEGWKDADLENIEVLAKTVASEWKKSDRQWIIIHGAGSFGHPLVIKYKINDGVKNTEQKLGASLTHQSCCELSLLLTAALNKNGVPAVSLPPATLIVSKNKRIHSFNTKIIDDYLSSGYLPVLFGDVVPDVELGASVCSGDQLVSYLGKKADKIIHATNVDGVLDDKGNVIPKINPSNFHEISKHFKSGKNDVTGAMKGKIEELLLLDTPSFIVNGLKSERLIAVLNGKKTVCTSVSRV